MLIARIVYPECPQKMTINLMINGVNCGKCNNVANFDSGAAVSPKKDRRKGAVSQ
jgi:hypothetical protein